MGRAEDRRSAKKFKKKLNLNGEQFKALQDETIEKMVMLEVRKRFDIIMHLVDEVLVKSMRDNRISEDRARKVIKDMYEEVVRRYEEKIPERTGTE